MLNALTTLMRLAVNQRSSARINHKVPANVTIQYKIKYCVRNVVAVLRIGTITL